MATTVTSHRSLAVPLSRAGGGDASTSNRRPTSCARFTRFLPEGVREFHSRFEFPSLCAVQSSTSRLIGSGTCASSSASSSSSSSSRCGSYRWAMFPDPCNIHHAPSDSVRATCLRSAKRGWGGGEEWLRRRCCANHRHYRVSSARAGRTSRDQLQGWNKETNSRVGQAAEIPRSRAFPGMMGPTYDCSRRGRVRAYSSSGARPEMEAEGHVAGGSILDDVPHLSDWLPNLPTYPNPLNADPAYRAARSWFIEENEVVAREVVVRLSCQLQEKAMFFRRAGPRERIAFKPEEVVAGIVTCGGLCPGLNTVIRELVCVLWTQYCVRNILGIEGGYRGFYARNTIPLNPKIVNDIHKRGGTILGTSRGGHEVTKIVNSIEDRGMNQVYIIGGDGTQRGADVIHREIVRRGLKVAVAGIPKTIDNDIEVIDRSFGFDTAVEEAQRAINAAHVEAQSVQNGVGVVKLMGRYSGYIAMHATLASRDVDCCLIPELPFYLEGKGGLYEFVEKRLHENGHMVIVVAEGAGQDLIARSVNEVVKSDESGNRLLLDVGMWLSSQLKSYWELNRKGPMSIKYIDPTYMVRAVPSNASDSVYCTLLAHSAVHGAMAGFTGFVAGPVNGRHAYIPIARVTEKQNQVNVHDRMWARLLSSTNQPDFMRYKQILDERRRLRECEADRLERCLQSAAAAAAVESVDDGHALNESHTEIPDNGNGKA